MYIKPVTEVATLWYDIDFVINQFDHYTVQLLDACYDKCLNGIPQISPSIEDMANDYLKKHKTKEK